jgi:hypothetical protein
MKALVINTSVNAHRHIFAMRAIIPLAIILTIILLSLLLPGTVLAGPGTTSSRCGGSC